MMKKIVEPHLNSQEELVQGNWLGLRRLHYTNKFGHRKTWECAYRLKSQGAALIIAVTEPTDRLILVRQFRPPLNARVLELPAGLIDDGEDAAATAVRELYEETGYRGEVTAVFPPTSNSPGLTSEVVTVVLMKVDETVHDEQPETPEMEADEDIETILVEKSKLLDFIRESQQRGDQIDSKLLTYAIALNHES